MWLSFWRSFDRFSLHHFKYVINELRAIEVVDAHNWELVVDLVQSIAEIVTYGDKQDSKIFECFMENQVLAEFVRILKISMDSRIVAPLLQYLSIMIQNMDTEHSVYYCFSNNYVNSIVAHHYKFDAGDLAQYYVAFLRALSSKINRDILCLLVNVHQDTVISFPLYTEAIKFAQHEEKMIQAAVRALTLNIYNVSDDMVYQFITTPPVSKFFSDLVHSLKEKCVHLDSVVHATEETCNNQRSKEILSDTDKIDDDLYYLKDILCVGESRLSKVVMQNVLDLLVLPALLPLLQLRPSDGLNLSPITAFYMVSRVLQVLNDKNICNFLAGIILYPCMYTSESNPDQAGSSNFLQNHLNVVENLLCAEVPESVDESSLLRNSPKYILSHSHSATCPMDQNVCPERRGILKYVLSDDHGFLLASLFVVLTLSEIKDLESLPTRMVGSNVEHVHFQNLYISNEPEVDGSVLVKFVPLILKALLKALASDPPTFVLVKLHAGWFLRKLLVGQVINLDENNLLLFNASHDKSIECFSKEFEGCWFDYILEALTNEWTSCKMALEESSQSKDPSFLLNLAISQQMTDGDATSSRVAWHVMVDAVKVFVLHLQLKAFVCKGESVENDLDESMSDLPINSRRTTASDLSSANFGSEVSLVSAVPCRIAFSNAGIRDIYIIPTAKGLSGKLLLVEKHPFRSQRGVVIAIAPLAGLSPTIDVEHPTWLHLRIREFDPRLNTGKTRGYNSKEFNHVADGRWTIDFPNARACEAARGMIVNETSKLRLSIKSSVTLLLGNHNVGDYWHSQGH